MCIKDCDSLTHLVGAVPFTGIPLLMLSNGSSAPPGWLDPGFTVKEVQVAFPGKVVESEPQRIQRLELLGSSKDRWVGGCRSLLPGAFAPVTPQGPPAHRRLGSRRAGQQEGESRAAGLPKGSHLPPARSPRAVSITGALRIR